MLKKLPMTTRLNNTGSIKRNLQLPEKNQSPPKTPTAEPESQASVLRTLTTACFFSAFKELIFNSLSFSKTIASWWSGWSAIAWLASLVFVSYTSCETYDALFTLLSTICHRARIDQSGTPMLGWQRVRKVKKGLQTVFSCLAFFPTQPYCHTALLESWWLNTRLSPGI